MAAASAVYWSIVEKYYFYLLTYTPCYMWLLCRKVRLKRIKSVYVTDPGLSNGSDTFPPAKPPTLIIENAEKSSLINWFFWKVLIQKYSTRVNNDVIHLRWILNLNRPCIVIRLVFSVKTSLMMQYFWTPDFILRHKLERHKPDHRTLDHSSRRRGGWA